MPTRAILVFAILAFLLGADLQPVAGARLTGGSVLGASARQANCRAFPETGKSVCDRFLTYWMEHGGLAQQGFPITGQFLEVSEVDGKSYAVQYFERAVFEMHPENRAPY